MNRLFMLIISVMITFFAVLPVGASSISFGDNVDDEVRSPGINLEQGTFSVTDTSGYLTSVNSVAEATAASSNNTTLNSQEIIPVVDYCIDKQDWNSRRKLDFSALKTDSSSDAFSAQSAAISLDGKGTQNLFSGSLIESALNPIAVPLSGSVWFLGIGLVSAIVIKSRLKRS